MVCFGGYLALKRVRNNIHLDGSLLLVSDNAEHYPPQPVAVDDVQQIARVHMVISRQD